MVRVVFKWGLCVSLLSVMSLRPVKLAFRFRTIVYSTEAAEGSIRLQRNVEKVVSVINVKFTLLTDS